MLLNNRFYPVAIATLLLLSFNLSADVYLRDYTHRAGDADSKLSSRAIALDQVKKLLLEEIGIHVRSRLEIKKNQDGLQFAQEEIETLTAGVVSVDILEEKWDGLTFYLKAKMEADPDEVLTAIDQFRQRDSNLVAQLELERRALREARSELEKYKNGFAMYKGEDLSVAADNYNKNVNVIQAYDYIEEGIRLSRRGSYVKAAGMLGEAHKLGNDRATIALSTMYFFGRGVKKDSEEADTLFRSVKDKIIIEAENGEAFYQNALGIMYSNGLGGVDKNTSVAKKWFERAVGNGFIYSFNNLAALYWAEQRFDKAIEQYQHLIDESSPLGYHGLAFMYHRGNGVEQDYKKALSLYQKAAAIGYSESIVIIASYYLQGIGGVEVDYGKALEMFEKAAELGAPNAYAGIANIYLNGRGVERNAKKAHQYFIKGASHGSPLSYLYLGIMNMNGQYIQRDLQQAKHWFQKAVDAGESRGEQYLLMLMGS